MISSAIASNTIRVLAATAAVMFCSVMISGWSYNRIKYSPYRPRTDDQNIISKYINDGSKKQFVLESHLIAAINVLISLTCILMIETAGGVWENRTPNRVRKTFGTFRKLFILMLLVLLCALLSFMLSLFKRKIWGYPYRFMFEV